jgi:propionyl-CoA synthetase
MPMIAEATVRHAGLRPDRCDSLGGVRRFCAAYNLAVRIDDAKPKVMVTSDAGMRGGKAVPYKHLVDESMQPGQVPAGKSRASATGVWTRA